MMMARDEDTIEFSTDDVNHSIPDRFEKIARRYGNQLAVKTPTDSLTYDALNQAANRLARAILQQQRIEKSPIALLFDHDAPCLVALLGVLKAGKVYVPLDVSAPLPRLIHILDDSQPRVLITNNSNMALAKQLSERVALLNLDQLDETLVGHNLELSIPPDTLACVFYTSGSTGTPKGVLRSHRQVLNRAQLEVTDYEIGVTDRTLLLYSYSFGASSSDIFNTLLSGATLYFHTVKETAITQLSDSLIQAEITLFHLPVLLLQQWLESLTPTQTFPKLRLVTPSGKLYRMDVERIRLHLSDTCLLIHRLSSSETGAVTRFTINHQTEISGPVVPVGYAIADREIFLLNEAGEPVGHNQIGEIVIKSHYLSPGYWRKPDLTAQRFRPSPENDGTRLYYSGDLGRFRPDGCLELVGRKDFMVKIRGYRVEPSEVESALAQLDSIKQAAVIAQTSSKEDPRLVAYVVPRPHSAPTTGTLRRALLKTLPDYMIPAAFVVLDTLPMTLNGKLDRAALPAVDWGRPNLDTAFVFPRTSLEYQVAEIWSAVLKCEAIGINDDFLELGGHSLQAMQIVTRVAQEFQVNLPIQLLFQSSTVATMADMILQHQVQFVSEEELTQLLVDIEQFPNFD